MRKFACFVLMLCGVSLVAVGCFHPNISSDAGFGSSIVGIFFTILGWVGLQD